MRAKTNERKRPPKPLSRARLERMAIRYLERFPASEKHFIHVMNRQIRRAHERCPGDETQYATWLEHVHELCRRAGLLDDERLCQGLVTSFYRRGYSVKDIKRRLGTKGFQPELVDSKVDGHLRDIYDHMPMSPDLLSALRYLKKARLGPFHAHPIDYATRQRHLARLARRGFSYSVAQEAFAMNQETALGYLRDYLDTW